MTHTDSMTFDMGWRAVVWPVAAVAAAAAAADIVVVAAVDRIGSLGTVVTAALENVVEIVVGRGCWVERLPWQKLVH